MYTLTPLLLAALAVAIIAGPPGFTEEKSLPEVPDRLYHQPRPYIQRYILTRTLLPNNVYGYEENARLLSASESMEDDWVDQEIDRLNQMEEEEEDLSPIQMAFSSWISQKPFVPEKLRQQQMYIPDTIQHTPEIQPLKAPDYADIVFQTIEPKQDVKAPESRRQEEDFALTPKETGFYETDGKIPKQKSEDRQGTAPEEHHEGNILSKTIVLEPPRQIRQNPISRTKNLVAENIERLKIGFTGQDSDSTDSPNDLQKLDYDPSDSMFGMIVIASVGIFSTVIIIGFAVGLYTLNRKAKAAAEVDYPTYGVTGPTIDSSGDRKLAHSAHMYHYQHQKQQIIAMERNGLEQRNGSVSDPESEEENEEGDYTVYECPGFATTGEMEVKNPLFSEDPTPATPGKCELVKPQPKE